MKCIDLFAHLAEFEVPEYLPGFPHWSGSLMSTGYVPGARSLGRNPGEVLTLHTQYQSSVHISPFASACCILAYRLIIYASAERDLYSIERLLECAENILFSFFFNFIGRNLVFL